MKSIYRIGKLQAQNLWMVAQGLNERGHFGVGPNAVTKVVKHLGYVQIDTINVIERCHHHIFYSRIPKYRRSYLHKAQSKDKTIFEYWTHALAYVPTSDYRFFKIRMQQNLEAPNAWYQTVKSEELKKVFELIKKSGPISIRDIKDDVLVEKDHDWGSRKPSKKALQLAFNQGRLVISERVGMLKKYELSQRHFKWTKQPRAATENELNEYLLDRALRSQAIVSLDSICHLEPSRKPAMLQLIEKKIGLKKLIPIELKESEKIRHWMLPELLEQKIEIDAKRVHIFITV
jgi:uncharacterized protein YcaQ